MLHPVTGSAKPLGIDPVALEGQVVLDDLPHVVEMDFGRRASPVAAAQRRHQRGAAGVRAVVLEEEPPQEVVPAQRRALPEE